MNKLEALNCIEVTSQTQANNGTVCYHDPVTNVDYLSYESGYVRRAYTRNARNYRGYAWSNRTIYQLNPTRMTEHTYQLTNGDTRTYIGKERIMINTHAERMELAARAVINYRNTCKRYKQLS